MSELLTLAQAQTAVDDWQARHKQAQDALAAHKQRMGQLALNGSAQAAAQDLARLETEATIAAQAVQAAEAQVGAAKQQEAVARIARLRAEADELDKEADAWQAKLDEILPKFIEARDRTNSLRHTAEMKRDNALRREINMKHPMKGR